MAGAIRDGVEEDIAWRERLIDAVGDRATILNPLAGNTYSGLTRRWSKSGLDITPAMIVAQDFWHVDRADLIVFNFSALDDRYPNIGTLVEFGRATAMGCLIYSILPAGFAGGKAMFSLHPFLARNSALVFPDADDCIAFVARHVDALSGRAPRYRP